MKLPTFSQYADDLGDDHGTLISFGIFNLTNYSLTTDNCKYPTLFF